MIRLPAKLYSQIVSHETTTEPAKEERRSMTRNAWQQSVAMARVDSNGIGTPSIVKTRDIAVGGISFFFSQPLRMGDQVMIGLPRTGEDPVRVLCTVTRWYPSEDGQFIIGAVFEKMAA